MLKQKQAAHILASHLTAHGHQVRISSRSLILTVNNKEVKIAMKKIPSDDLMSSSPELHLRSVNEILSSVGAKNVDTTIYRAVLPRRAKMADDFEDIIFRAKGFSRCPNPPAAIMAKYDSIAKKVAKSVFFRFKLPLLAIGYDEDDMGTVARVHLITAIHRYRTGDHERDSAIITRYLRQRLTEVVRKCQKKSLNCSADTRQRCFAQLDSILLTNSDQNF